MMARPRRSWQAFMMKVAMPTADVAMVWRFDLADALWKGIWDLTVTEAQSWRNERRHKILSLKEGGAQVRN
jgi:hypothetical protein